MQKVLRYAAVSAALTLSALSAGCSGSGDPVEPQAPARHTPSVVQPPNASLSPADSTQAGSSAESTPLTPVCPDGEVGQEDQCRNAGILGGGGG